MGEEEKAKTSAPIKDGERGLVLTDIDDMWRFSEMVVQSRLAPKSFQIPQQVMVAMQMGAELGMSPLQSLQSIIVVDGKVSMYVADMRALVESHPDCELIEDNLDSLKKLTTPPEEWDDNIGVTVRAKRRGRPKSIKRTFSVGDAKRAGLWMKRGPRGPSAWITYPKRMLYNRAMGFAMNDTFRDILRGMKSAEEYEDYPSDDVVVESGPVAPSLNELADQLDEEADSSVPAGAVSSVGLFPEGDKVEVE